MKQDILSLEVMSKLKDSAPSVTVPSYEAARAVLKALNMYAAGNKPRKDVRGVVYWHCGLDDLLGLIDVGDLTNKAVGTICRTFQLVMKRENDGFKVAFSQSQLDILNVVIQ